MPTLENLFFSSPAKNVNKTTGTYTFKLHVISDTRSQGDTVLFEPDINIYMYRAVAALQTCMHIVQYWTWTIVIFIQHSINIWNCTVSKILLLTDWGGGEDSFVIFWLSLQGSHYVMSIYMYQDFACSPWSQYLQII